MRTPRSSGERSPDDHHASGQSLEPDDIELKRRMRPTHLSPFAAACGERSDCYERCKASSGAIRVRGSHRAHLCSEFAEAAPHPDALSVCPRTNGRIAEFSEHEA